MAAASTCSCSGVLKMRFKEIVLDANICPGFLMGGSRLSLQMENLSFSSKEVSAPQCYQVAEGKGLSVSGFGALTVTEEGSREQLDAFFNLFMIESRVGADNLASLTLSSITGNGAIVSYALSFISDKVDVTITPHAEPYALSRINFRTVSSLRQHQAKIIIFKNDRIIARDLLAEQ